MGKYQRDKGYRGEYQLVKKLNKEGIKAIRVPLSGSCKNDIMFSGDIVIQDKYKGEVKVRKSGFKLIYNYLNSYDFLFIKQDRRDYLVCMKLEKFIELLK